MSRTVVFAAAFSRPDFIELQDRLFKRFLEDDYEFHIVCDAGTPADRAQIADTCERLGLPCHHVPQEIHDRPYLHRGPDDNFNNPNVRHCNSVQWAWNTLFSRHDGPVMVIDSDMFMIREFSVARSLGHHHLAGVYWGTSDMKTGESRSYLWLALILLNNPRLPVRDTLCFNCGFLPGTSAVCDSGGWTNLYLTAHRDVLQVSALSYLQGHEFFCPYRYAATEAQQFADVSSDDISRTLAARGFTPAEIDLALKKPYTIELLADNHFLHYRAGTNYEKYPHEFLARKDAILHEFFERILNE